VPLLLIAKKPLGVSLIEGISYVGLVAAKGKKGVDQRSARHRLVARPRRDRVWWRYMSDIACRHSLDHDWHDQHGSTRPAGRAFLSARAWPNGRLVP
jgi:hypothetical protein